MYTLQLNGPLSLTDRIQPFQGNGHTTPTAGGFACCYVFSGLIIAWAPLTGKEEKEETTWSLD